LRGGATRVLRAQNEARVGRRTGRTAAAIAKALGTFSPDELVDAAVALCAASLRVLADEAGTTVAHIVAWSAADAPAAPAVRPVLRPTRASFCARNTLVAPPRNAARSR
jgi:hypothetical protein